MLYLDSNIFIYSTLNTETLGRNARSLLKKIQQGEETAVTSALTYDEVFWAVRKHNVESAFQACEALLNFPHLEIVPADRQLALSSLQLIRTCNLAPRDALHAVTALSLKADYFVTTDADFSKVAELKLKSL